MEKKSTFCGIFRGKFAEKSVDFAVFCVFWGISPVRNLAKYQKPCLVDGFNIVFAHITVAVLYTPQSGKQMINLIFIVSGIKKVSELTLTGLTLRLIFKFPAKAIRRRRLQT